MKDNEINKIIPSSNSGISLEDIYELRSYVKMENSSNTNLIKDLPTNKENLLEDINKENDPNIIIDKLKVKDLDTYSNTYNKILNKENTNIEYSDRYEIISQDKNNNKPTKKIHSIQYNDSLKLQGLSYDKLLVNNSSSRLDLKEIYESSHLIRLSDTSEDKKSLIDRTELNSIKYINNKKSELELVDKIYDNNKIKINYYNSYIPEDLSELNSSWENIILFNLTNSQLRPGKSVLVDRKTLKSTYSNNQRLIRQSENKNIILNDSFDNYNISSESSNISDSKVVDQLTTREYSDKYNGYDIQNNILDNENGSETPNIILDYIPESSSEIVDKTGRLIDESIKENYTNIKDINSINSEDYSSITESKYQENLSKSVRAITSLHETPTINKVEKLTKDLNPDKGNRLNKSIDLIKAPDLTKFLKYNETNESDLNVQFSPRYTSDGQLVSSLEEWMGIATGDYSTAIEASSKYRSVMENLSAVGSVIGSDSASKAAGYITSLMGNSKRFFQKISPHDNGLNKLNELGLVRLTFQGDRTNDALDGLTKQELLDQLLLTTFEAKQWALKKLNQDKGSLPGKPSDDSFLGKVSDVINIGKDVIDIGSDILRGDIGGAIDGIKNFGKTDILHRPFPTESKVDGSIIADNTIYGGSNDKNSLFNPSTANNSPTNSPMFKDTLKDLADLGDRGSITEYNKLSDLRDLLLKSLITTKKKIYDKDTGISRLGLDSNDNWELILKPYEGELNGGFSFLPSIIDMQFDNMNMFNINMRYSDCINQEGFMWIPVNSFELQNKKLTQKTVGLYDGDFSFPVSMEFTNELRINFIDDSFKTWRRYFQKCADVAVYNSYKSSVFNSKLELDNSAYRSNSFFTGYTTIDYSTQVVSLYKNIAFECKIYVMTPGLESIKKFDLLIVLRDFQEEYTGDIDAGGSELSVHFSIVGDLSYDSNKVGNGVKGFNYMNSSELNSSKGSSNINDSWINGTDMSSPGNELNNVDISSSSPGVNKVINT